MAQERNKMGEKQRSFFNGVNKLADILAGLEAGQSCGVAEQESKRTANFSLRKLRTSRSVQEEDS